MATITGKETMFINVTLSKAEIDLINLSPTFVDQLLKYNQEVLTKKVNSN
jgi:hypothetical protein